MIEKPETVLLTTFNCTVTEGKSGASRREVIISVTPKEERYT